MKTWKYKKVYTHFNQKVPRLQGEYIPQFWPVELKQHIILVVYYYFKSSWNSAFQRQKWQANVR